MLGISCTAGDIGDLHITVEKKRDLQPTHVTVIVVLHSMATIKSVASLCHERLQRQWAVCDGV